MFFRTLLPHASLPNLITRLPDKKVCFESTNYRGEFMTALKDGRLVKMRDAL